MRWQWFVILVVSACASQVQAKGGNPEFNIRAKFRDANDESVGNATFLVKNRFMQLYYGGVVRQDEYRFKINLEASAFANQSFDVFLDDFFVGTHAADSGGLVDVTYRSDFKPGDEPDFPLPANFPDPVNVGDVVNIFESLTGNLLLSSALEEGFLRGDADLDGDVDTDDLSVFQTSFGGFGIGPEVGDFDGDDDSDGSDFLMFQRNFTGPAGGAGFQAVPEPSTLVLFAMAILGNGALWARRWKNSGQ